MISQIFAPNLMRMAMIKTLRVEQSLQLDDQVGLVISGVISEDIDSDRGYGSMTLRLAGPNTLINIVPIFSGSDGVNKRFVCETRMATIAVVRCSHFNESIQSSTPDAMVASAQELLLQYHQSLTDMEETCSALRVGSIDDRVIWALQRFRQVAGNDKAFMKKRRLAAHLGVAVETISRTLTRLEEEGRLVRKGPHEIYLREELQ